MICFKKVTKQLDDYKSVKELYLSAFPSVERVPFWLLMKNQKMTVQISTQFMTKKSGLDLSMQSRTAKLSMCTTMQFPKGEGTRNRSCRA